MKKVKSIKCNIDNSLTLYSEHSIYEPSKDEMNAISIQKKYLLNLTYGTYAMENISHIELLKSAKRDSEYIYGVAFTNTIEEAELMYKNAVLEAQIIDFRRKIEKMLIGMNSTKK